MNALATLISGLRGLAHQERQRAGHDADGIASLLMANADSTRRDMIHAARIWPPPTRAAGLRDVEWVLALGVSASAHLERTLARGAAAAVEQVIAAGDPGLKRLATLGETIDGLLTTVTPGVTTLLAPRLGALAEAMVVSMRLDLPGTLAIAMGADRVRASLRRDGLAASASLPLALALENTLVAGLADTSSRDSILRAWADSTHARLFDAIDDHLSACEVLP